MYRSMKKICSVFLSVLLLALPFTLCAAAEINEQGNYSYQCKSLSFNMGFDEPAGHFIHMTQYPLDVIFFTALGARIEDPLNTAEPAAYVLLVNRRPWDDTFNEEQSIAMGYGGDISITINDICYDSPTVYYPNDWIVYIDLADGEAAGAYLAGTAYSKMIQAPFNKMEPTENGVVRSVDGETLYSYPAGLQKTFVQLPVTVKHIRENAFAGCNSITDVYYPGTEADWAAVEIAEGNDPLLNAAMHFNMAGPHYEHTWDDGAVKTEPTCTDAGEREFTCTVCGAVRSESIPATGHTDANNDGVCDNGCGTVLGDPNPGNGDTDDTDGRSFLDILSDFFKKIIEFFRNLFR